MSTVSSVSSVHALSQLSLAGPNISTTQIQQFCENFSISMYVLDLEFKIFFQNTLEKRSHHYPSLVYVVANHHLYPVIEKSVRDYDEEEPPFPTIVELSHPKYRAKFKLLSFLVEFVADMDFFYIVSY